MVRIGFIQDSEIRIFLKLFLSELIELGDYLIYRR